MTRTQTIQMAILGSIALLGGAYIFELLGYAPCKMCLWQRWPHALAIWFGVLALLAPRLRAPLSYTAAAAALLTGGIGLYHTGVERGWWEGPSSCTGNGAGLDPSIDLLSTDIAPIVMCDDVVWSIFGLSMASYNALISLALALLWLKAARKT